MIKIALLNQKGGVAKTTSAVNIASNLAELDYSVLTDDLDPQRNMGYNLGLETEDLTNTIYDVLIKNADIEKSIHKTDFNVDILPSNLLLSDAELELSSKMNRESILKNAFIKSKLDYDYCILDLPPNLGLLTLNGLTCCDYVIIPLDTGIFSLAGINQLVSIIHLIKDNNLNPDLEILGVLLTKVDDRTNLSKEMRSTLEDIFEDKVFESYIHDNVKIPESQKEQKPMNFYLPNNRGNLEYKNLMKELINRVNR